MTAREKVARHLGLGAPGRFPAGTALVAAGRSAVVASVIAMAILGATRAPASAGCLESKASSRATRPATTTVEPRIDAQAAQELQRAFEHGHQPWRGDPRWVAAVAVLDAQAGIAGTATDASALVGRLRVECETASDSIVAGRDASHRYTVHLKRLAPSQAGQRGMWTATRVEISPAD